MNIDGNKIFAKLAKNKALIITLFMLFTIRWSFADHYYVPSGSMQPTIEIGDQVFVNKMAYDIKIPFTNISLMETNKPKRGEIIVFKYPLDPSINYVKRLIALPGDHVQIKDGFVWINGKNILLNHRDIFHLKRMLAYSNDDFNYREKLDDRTFTVNRKVNRYSGSELSFVVPKNQYFFMGDNRDNSSDGRQWGFVPRSYLKGRVERVLLSFTMNNLIPEIKFHRIGQRLI